MRSYLDSTSPPSQLFDPGFGSVQARKLFRSFEAHIFSHNLPSAGALQGKTIQCNAAVAFWPQLSPFLTDSVNNTYAHFIMGKSLLLKQILEMVTVKGIGYYLC
jgi:hypothetical protein